MTRLVAIDFFCGAGGMTNGLIQAGLHVIAGVDNEPLCASTYNQNKNTDGSTPEFICNDIFPKSQKRPNGEQHIIEERIENLLRNYRRDKRYRKLKLIFAICAPCQPFTKITKIQLSSSGQYKRDNDSDLLLTTINLIKRFRPAAIICENVEGISEGKNSVLQAFRRRLAHAGYSFDANIINAADYGVPQNRKRTIGLAFDKSVYSGQFEVLTKNPSLRKYVSVRKTIGKLPPIAAGESHAKIPNHRARNLGELNLKRISCAPPGLSNRYLIDTPYGDLSLACHQRIEKKTGERSFSDTYTRMHGDEPAPTITTKFISISNGRFGHYDTRQNRAITPREAALLQTFPRNYVFYPEDNLEFTATLIGNAVPPKLAKFFGEYIAQTLE